MLQYGETALHWAAYHDHAEVIPLLMKHGAALDIRNEVLTLLHRSTIYTSEVEYRQAMIVLTEHDSK